MRMGASTKEAARILGVPLTTLAKAVWLERVHSPAKGPGGAYHWTRDDLIGAGWALLKRDLSDRIDAVLAEGDGHD